MSVVLCCCCCFEAAAKATDASDPLFLLLTETAAAVAIAINRYFGGHQHWYERLWPIINGSVISHDYHNMTSPVYIVTGAGGNDEDHSGKKFHAQSAAAATVTALWLLSTIICMFSPSLSSLSHCLLFTLTVGQQFQWTAVLDQLHFGYSQLEILNATTAHLTFISSADGQIIDDIYITRTRSRAAAKAATAATAVATDDSDSDADAGADAFGSTAVKDSLTSSGTDATLAAASPTTATIITATQRPTAAAASASTPRASAAAGSAASAVVSAASGSSGSNSNHFWLPAVFTFATAMLSAC